MVGALFLLFTGNGGEVGWVDGREQEPEIQRCKYWSRHILMQLVDLRLPSACQLCENTSFLSRQEITDTLVIF